MVRRTAPLVAVVIGFVLSGCYAAHGADEGGDAGSAACEPGESRCTSLTERETCSAPGAWEADEPCVNECVAGECLPVPPSCQGLPETCGPEGDAFCCRSPLVEGGTYDRLDDPDLPATVSDFRLDQYEVTVGRFRKFVEAVVEGWRPEEGAGQHAHLNGGEGLAGGEGFEPGWIEAWNDELPDDQVGWNDFLAGCRPGPVDDTWTWTETPGEREVLPITCASWYAAYAFCIWDGGFLPSDAEWNYAAAGGDAQRLYPWGDEAPGENAELAIYDCRHPDAEAEDCTGVDNVAPVGSAPAGDGMYGQADLAGNVWEWTLDFAASSDPTCEDCVQLEEDASRVVRGGAFYSDAAALRAAIRSALIPRRGYEYLGFRCARAP